MHHTNVNERERGVLYCIEIGNKYLVQENPSRIIRCLWFYIWYFLAGQISISSLVLRTQRAADSQHHAGFHQLCLLACGLRYMLDDNMLLFIYYQSSPSSVHSTLSSMCKKVRTRCRHPPHKRFLG